MEYCIAAQDLRRQNQVSQEIDKQLQKERRDVIRTYKVLLLGAAESGKSTFSKQLRILYGEFYSHEEKQSFVKPIYRNVITAMQAIITAMDRLNIQYDDASNIEQAEIVKAVDIDTLVILEPQVIQAIKALWRDPGVQECFSRRREFKVLDSIEYFMNVLDRISSPGYLPLQGDIIRAYSLTTELVDYRFELEAKLFRVVYVGNQPSYSSKWIHCFDNNSAVILYFVDLTKYNQNLINPKGNDLKETVYQFQDLLAYISTRGIPISLALLLNKVDLFEEKIRNSHLADYFPEYNGPKQDVAKAKDFILKMFLAATQNKLELLYVNFINATNEENIKTAFAAIRAAYLGLITPRH